MHCHSVIKIRKVYPLQCINVHENVMIQYCLQMFLQSERNINQHQDLSSADFSFGTSVFTRMLKGYFVLNMKPQERSGGYQNPQKSSFGGHEFDIKPAGSCGNMHCSCKMTYNLIFLQVLKEWTLVRMNWMKALQRRRQWRRKVKRLLASTTVNF